MELRRVSRIPAWWKTNSCMKTVFFIFPLSQPSGLSLFLLPSLFICVCFKLVLSNVLLRRELEGVFYIEECLYDEIFLSQMYPSLFIDGPDTSVPHLSIF